jgi:hypothetical protein
MSVGGSVATMSPSSRAAFGGGDAAATTMNRALSAGLRAWPVPRALPAASLKARLWRSLPEILFRETL